MLCSVNPKPSIAEFRKLMSATDILLNDDALKRPGYYASRGGNPLEDDVKSALEEAAIGTPFEKTIEKISGQKFPDIVAAKYYGVEVKSTKGDHWTSTGSSILESSRIASVERIFMTFGKLGGNPIKFLSRPYEECLSGIVVTHMPRYLIDMRLDKGNTIFKKIGVEYDILRCMDNPVVPVSKYYRSILKPGETLWWMGDNSDETVSPTIKLWRNISPLDKRRYTTYGCVNFPEVFAGDYDRYTLWLTSQGIANPNVRDQFSAGGCEVMGLSDGSTVRLPGVYKRIRDNIDLFVKMISNENPADFQDYNKIRQEELELRIRRWSEIASRYSRVDYQTSVDALNLLFARYFSTKK